MSPMVYPRGILVPALTLIFTIMSVSCTENKSDLADGLYAELTTPKGSIIVKLYPDDAPLTVMNFVGLAEGKLDFANRSGPFYDGLVFHRVIDDFMIQGGDPEGAGHGGPGYQFADETDNGLLFDRPGLLAMANSGPNTNGSQFFITRVVTDWLNGNHTVFGEVVKGQDAVDAMEQGDAMTSVKVLRLGSAAKKYRADSESFREIETAVTRRQQSAREEKAKALTKDITARWPGAVRDDETGIYSAVQTEGTGGNPASGTRLTVHYTGTLMDGTQFDSSRDRGEPFQFDVGNGQVILGWDLSFLKMKKGERRIIILPPEMGYGARGVGPIPPNSWLIFDVELLDF